MTVLSDKLNSLAGGDAAPAVAPAAPAVAPAAPAVAPAAVPSAAPTPAPGGTLTERLINANGGPAPASTAINAPDPNETGNPLWYDIFHPQDADLTRPQTWRDWATKTYYPTGADLTRAAADDVSFGTADYAQSKLTGEDVDKIRDRTAQSQAALGPMGPVVNAFTYVLPGTGEMKAVALPGKAFGWAARKAAPYVGRYGAAALEGGAASSLSSAGHQLGPDGISDIDPTTVMEDAAKGAVFGVGGQAVGRGVQRVADTGPVRRVMDYVAGLPGRESDPLFGNARAQSNAGADAGPAISAIQSTILPNAPTHPGLTAAYDASQRSIAPGPLANAASNVARVGAQGLSYSLFGLPALFTNSPGEWAQGKVQDWARSSNAAARNQAVQSALDQVYHQATGNPLTVNTQGWPEAWRQLTIGGSRAPLSEP